MKAATGHAALVRKCRQSAAETQPSIFLLCYHEPVWTVTNLYFFRSRAEPERNFYLWNETETGMKNISFQHPAVDATSFLLTVLSNATVIVTH